MDKINFDFFDFFGAVIPGIPTFIILCFFIGDIPFSFDTIISFLQTSPLSVVTAILLSCYILGFCLHYPSYEVFQPLVNYWGHKRTLGFPISIGKREKELVKIRHNSPDNFKLISKFLALRQMAYTMFFSLLVFAIILATLTVIRHTWSWDIWSALLISLVLSFLFLRRSVAFHQRIQEMITEAVLLN